MKLYQIIEIFISGMKHSSLYSLWEQTQTCSYQELIDFFNKEYLSQDEIKSLCNNKIDFKEGNLCFDEIVLSKSNTKGHEFVKKRYKSAGGYVVPGVSIVLLVWTNGVIRIPLRFIFNKKHKYTLKKKLKIEEIIKALTEEKIFLIRAKASEEEIQEIDKALAEPENYEFAISNYKMNYTYTVVTYKYMDTSTGKYISEDSHILTGSFEKDGMKEDKINIIFIDIEKMSKSVSRQHKQIDKYLESFTHSFVFNKETFYFKEK